jgi:RNA polymerase sigma-70 factor (ECF subfamily)
MKTQSDRRYIDVMEMGVGASGETVPPFDFEAFYADALPIVYGYVLRLCGGDHERTRDLTQDTWLKLVDELDRGHTEKANLGWLVAVARSRFLDAWRSDQRRERNLRLAWYERVSRDVVAPELDATPDTDELLTHLAHLQPEYRIAMTLRYIDGLPIPEVGRLMGRTTTATYSLLARARTELKSRAGVQS